MLIEATIQSEKSKILQERYIELVNGGISPEKILVICLNSYKKKIFTDEIEKGIRAPIFGKHNIHTFFGLCYNAVAENWVTIENTISGGKPFILPNLCGLELSRTFLSESIKEKIFKDYFSKTNLLHQLFKRMQLIVLNGLSEKAALEKSEILKESFFEDTKKAYDKFRRLTLKYRSFDYLRQISMLPYIQEHTDYFKNIEYLFVDDADEMTYAEFDFIQKLRPQLKEQIICYDKNGASRCGYLSAYKTAVFEFEKIFKEKAQTPFAKTTAEKRADFIYEQILSEKKVKTDNFEIKSFIKRPDMLDAAFEKIDELMKNGVKTSDIVIITPIADEMLKMFLERHFCGNTKFQLISGSEKPNENKILRNIFTFLKLVHKNWNAKIEAQELRCLFFECLQIPMKYSQKAVNTGLNNGELSEVNFEKEIYQKSYDEFKEYIENFSEKKLSFSEEILNFYEYFSKNGVSEGDLKKINFFLKEIRSFETAFGELTEGQKKSILMQFQNGIISENPSIAEEIDKNAIVIATPQKVIDFEIKTKYQIWLDVSNDLWTMRDIGVLYNAWVFNEEWKSKDFSIEDNIRLSREKSARVIRKLFLCCSKNIYGYFSQYDSSGYENIGKLQSYFVSDEESENKEKPKKIVPREDQKQVIEYKGGKAAVNAVPGAGKTTVLIALLIKLIEQGISPSKIFVLTYMESAATNIREKIKSALPDLTEIPNISTIHGLCFRIINENNNCTKLNLPENIEVADDNTIQKILRECISTLNLNHEDYDAYKTGISAVKLSPNGIRPLKNLKDKIHFAKVYNLYEKGLKKAGIIDYDDMLRYAVRLVEENEEIRKYYSEMCEYIFEDEAQDSSELQQKLLLMLSKKHTNLLRIGDINQAITSSFTDSDPKCFKTYFEDNEQMVMKTSQRSCEQIQRLANKMIDISKDDEFLKDTFFDSKLTPTGKNPISEKEPEFQVFEKQNEEKYFVLNRIKEIIKEKEKPTMAILLRNNYQISDWAKFLSDNGIMTTTRTDILEQKSVFQIIMTFLEFLQTPFSNDCVKNLAESFDTNKMIPFSKEDFEYIKNLKEPFIKTDGDDLSESLTHLWWELQFNDELTYIPPEEAAIKIGLRYFSTQNEKSNIYLISTIIKRLTNLYSDRETVLEKLRQISKRPIGSTFKFFEDEKDIKNEAVKLMTMHKSKGDEFDVVFIPELSEENYPLKKEKIKIKSNFSEEVKKLRFGYKNRSEDEIKKEIAEETMRLLYVGITRAKKELNISCSKHNRFNRKQNVSELFEKLGGFEEC